MGTKGVTGNRNKFLDTERNARMAKLKDEGVSLKAIAERFGCSVGSVSQAIHKWREKTRG